MPSPVICWFRQDLRLSDNLAWAAACKTGAPIIPVYILDDKNAGDWKMGAATRAWLHHSLNSLDKSLNGNLLVLEGKADDILPKLVKRHQATHLFWNRCYEPWRKERDTKIKDTLTHQGIKCESFNGSLLWEPWEIKNQSGEPYKVFTPYFRKGCLNAEPPRKPLATPSTPTFFPHGEKTDINSLKLLPQKPRWDKPMMSYWTVGEDAAHNRLTDFLQNKLSQYKEGRNFPALDTTSRLSAYLHFGEISPNQIWHTAIEHGTKQLEENNLDNFQSELAWREFSYSLLHYNPSLPEEPLNKKFNNFEWEEPDTETLERWQKGETGYPIVDAGMRELWATGYMHNRVRMIAASFLIKDLRYHWKLGEEWFWDTLVDADLANNAASWQWVAGCGADAAPYFRIFNPTTQGEKFDPQSEYVNKWAPDSKNIKPLVDHKEARNTALEAYKAIK